MGFPRKFVTTLNTIQAFLIGLVLTFCGESVGGVFELERSFYNPAPEYQDNFGYSVAGVDGNVLIAASRKDVTVKDEGIAYLYDSETGNLIRTFHNPTPALGDLFGSPSVSVGETVWISSVRDDIAGTDSGAIYVFETNTGELLDTIYSPNPSSSSTFGSRLVRLGDDVLVSAYREFVTEDRDGRVYLFDGESRELTRTFVSPNPSPDEGFGQGIALAGEDIVVTAKTTGSGGIGSFAAYLFDSETGDLLRTFSDPLPHVTDHPVVPVAVADGCVAIGSLLDGTMGPSTGAVLVFDLESGEYLRTIYNPGPKENAKFGTSVLGLGEILVVGAPANRDGTVIPGEVFAFDPATGELLDKLSNPTPQSRDFFGAALAQAGDDGLIVGAYYDNTGTNDTGAAFLYRADPPSDNRYELLVGSRYTDSVLRYDLETGDFEGALVPSGGGGLTTPYDLTVGPSGDLYVGSCADSNVLRYDIDTGQFLEVFVDPRSGGLSCPEVMHFGSDGGFYVASLLNDQVLRYDGASGEFLDVFAWEGGLDGPVGIAEGPDGNMYVSSLYSGQVLRYHSQSGEFIDVFASGGGLELPAGIVFGPHGNLYVCCIRTDSVLRYDGDTGEFIDVFVSPGSGGAERPHWPVFGPDGYLYLSSVDTDEVLRYDGQTGAFVDAIVPAGYGGLDGPTGLAFRPIPDSFNLPPSQPTVEITPDPPTTDDDLICRADGSIDPEGLPVSYSYAWFRDGDPVENESSFTISHSLTSHGETWKCLVTPSDGELEGVPASDSVVIGNAPPSQPHVHIEPEEPTTLDDLTCYAEGSEDPEGMPVLYHYRWYRDGNLVENESSFTLDHSLTAKGELWECMVTPSDGEVEGAPASDSVTIVNSPPTAPIIRILPENPTPEDGLAVWFDTPSTDPDEDVIVYMFEWYESTDGENWTRRPELSGNLRPFVSGTSQIVSLYTQVAEYWRIDVTPVEAYTVAKSLEDISRKTLVPVEGEEASDRVFIWSEIAQSGDGEGGIVIDAADLLFLKSVWHKQKNELAPRTQELFFESGAPEDARVGLSVFLSLAFEQWHKDLGAKR